MAPIPPLIFLVLLFSGARGLAIDQQVLTHDFHHSQPALPPGLQTLCSELSGQCILATPVPQPCYHQPPDFEEARCAKVQSNKTWDVWVLEQPGGYYYANWASCQSDGATCAVPLNLSSTDAIPTDKTCYQGSVPPLMVVPESTSDVQAVLKYVSSTNTSLVIKNTGHDWKGRSSGPLGLGLWTHNLRQPKEAILPDHNFQPAGCSSPSSDTVFHFGGGETWTGAYEAAEAHGLAVLGGTCGTVGMAGWLQGGGHSPMTPVYGMGVDNVREVEIVTVNGDVVIANECQNQDLFFAVRGGGGGTYGVITNITYKAIQKHEVQDFSANLTKLPTDAYLEFFNIVTANALRWADNGWGGYIKINSTLELANPKLSLSDAMTDMVNLTEFLSAYNATPCIVTRASWYKYYQKNLAAPTDHPSGWSAAVASRLIPPSAFEGLSRANLTAKLFGLVESKVSIWLMLVTPTIYNHTNGSALHPSWSTATWSVRIQQLWDQYWYPSPAENTAYFNHVHTALQPLRDMAPNMGISLNEADIWEPDAPDGFWGQDNYDRLLSIKNQVDPSNILTNWHAVGWNQTADRYRCYPTQ